MASSSNGKDSDQPISGDAELVNSKAIPTMFPMAIALQIYLVLENIFSYLSFSDLKTCSQVNRLWRKNSVLLLAEKSLPLQFQNNFKICRSRADVSRSAQSFIKLVKGSNGVIPCSKFEVDMTMDLFGKSDTKRNHRPFFKAIAPFVTELSIRCNFTSDIRQLNSSKCLDYPKLKILHFNIHGMTYLLPLTTGSFIGNIISAIIQQAPKLSKIILQTLVCSTELVNVLIEVLDCEQGRKIRHLKLVGDISNELLNQLSNAGLQLQIIELACKNYRVWHNSLKTFLESQTGTLESLSLENLNKIKTCSHNPLAFPRMTKLKSLKITADCESGGNEPLVCAFSYPEQFPNLIKLSIAKFGNSLKSLFSPALGPFEHLETLELPALKNDTSWISDAAKLFPNVRKLEIVLEEDVLKCVSQVFENVEELTIRLVEFDPKYNYSAIKPLTGYSTAELQMRLKLPPQIQQKVFPKMEQRPLTKFLHKLKVINLIERYDGQSPDWLAKKKRDEPVLSDIVFRLIFVNLRSLKCLDLGKCLTVQVSKETLCEMRRKFVVLCDDKNVIRADTLTVKINKEPALNLKRKII